MAEIAAKTLYTSEGVVAPGKPIPVKLPKREMEAIRAAGGIAVLPAAVRDDDGAKVRLYAEAVRELKLAENDVAVAKSDEEKATATERFENARRDLFEIVD